MTKLQEHLESLRACDDARLWAGEQTAQQTWDNCQNPSWLLWWAARTPENKKESVIRCATQFARLVLHLVPSGEDRPRLAIEAAEKWAENPTRENSDAAAYAAAYAADAAAYAADAARAAAYAAAYAAADAAAYAAADVARTSVLKQCCDICRKELVLPWSEEES